MHAYYSRYDHGTNNASNCRTDTELSRIHRQLHATVHHLMFRYQYCVGATLQSPPPPHMCGMCPLTIWELEKHKKECTWLVIIQTESLSSSTYTICASNIANEKMIQQNAPRIYYTIEETKDLQNHQVDYHCLFKDSPLSFRNFEMVLRSTSL